MGEMTDLESETLERLGEAREWLVAGTGLRDQDQRTSRACDFPVGNLHASRFGNIVLETWCSGRGHTPEGELFRDGTGRIPTEGGPQQHDGRRERSPERDGGARKSNWAQTGEGE